MMNKTSLLPGLPCDLMTQLKKLLALTERKIEDWNDYEKTVYKDYITLSKLIETETEKQEEKRRKKKRRKKTRRKKTKGRKWRIQSL